VEGTERLKSQMVCKVMSVQVIYESDAWTVTKRIETRTQQTWNFSFSSKIYACRSPKQYRD